MLKMVLMVVGICLGLFGVTAIVGVTAYNTVIHQEEEHSVVKEESKEVIEKNVTTKGAIGVEPEQQKPINKTIAILGTDKEGNRTDVILVVHFNSQTKRTDVISIPRDTKVDWKEDQKACLPDDYRGLEVSKMNEMTHYSQMRYIRGTVVNEIEAILGAKVDHYVIISIDAFKNIVDAIGGVEVDVPRCMKKDDYAQDLHIDLYPGLQLLDGEKAQQFVRFRDYRNGDVDRITAQQQFLKAFADKVMSPEIITKIPKIISVLFTSVRTDIAFTEIGDYLPYVKDLDRSQISFHTLPGEGRYENGVSYYFKDMENIETLANQVFFGN